MIPPFACAVVPLALPSEKVSSSAVTLRGSTLIVTPSYPVDTEARRRWSRAASVMPPA